MPELNQQQTPLNNIQGRKTFAYTFYIQFHTKTKPDFNYTEQSVTLI